jgi:hypothetical protein
MNEKTKQWLKTIGVAGFLFFLFKGILWLIFGTAIYNWLKSLLIVTAASLCPVLINAQSVPNFLNKYKFNNQIQLLLKSPQLGIQESNPKPFFCKLEDQINENKKTYFKFRLGSVEYSNDLEYSQYLYKKEIELPVTKKWQ